jgi:signal transduction histidine kinase
VLADRIRLTQVILNLITNGIEAMAAIADRPRVLLIRSQGHEPGSVLVAIKDSGMGIDPGDTDRIFAPFFTTKPNGLGMGLSISRSIVEAHGGRLWATPNDDQGTTFRFTLLASSD